MQHEEEAEARRGAPAEARPAEAPPAKAGGAGGRAARWSAGAVIALGTLALLLRPLITIDHDLWYHLSHGRFILGGGGIPETSYFSFLTPERTWIAYYWLFGVAVAVLHGITGELGLIVLRAVLFAVTMAAVYGVVFARRSGESAVAPAWGAFLVALTAVALVTRFVSVRPHMASYALIAVFLFVLEKRPRWLLALPPLAVLWVNVHGIEYPVMLAIVGAYLGAYFAARIAGVDPGATWSEAGHRRLMALALAAIAVLATPHGARLLRVPFVDTGFASAYIVELRRLDLAGLLRFDLLPLAPASASNLLIVLAVAAGVVACARRPLPLARLGLLAVGLLLILRSQRFRPEMALLALPLLAGVWPARPPTSPTASPRSRPAMPRLARLLLAAGAVLAALAVVQDAVGSRHHAWPSSRYGRPDGVARFLEQVGVGSRLLNHPDHGGYFQWAVGPRMRILTDMEVPFLFSDEDHYRATAAFEDPEVLAGVIRDYRPDFIAAPSDAGGFGAVLAAGAPRYRPVFFDDLVVLYADAERHPELASAWSFAGLDPLALTPETLARQAPDDLARLRHTLERMVALAPAVDRPRRTLALLHWLEGRASDAVREARAAANAAPWAWQPLVVLGNFERELGRSTSAVGLLEDALARADDGGGGVLPSLARAYAAAGRADDAYRTLEAAVGRFSRAAPAAVLAQLGDYAMAAGELDDARLYLTVARRKTPPDDRRAVARLDALLERLGASAR